MIILFLWMYCCFCCCSVCFFVVCFSQFLCWLVVFVVVFFSFSLCLSTGRCEISNKKPIQCVQDRALKTKGKLLQLNETNDDEQSDKNQFFKGAFPNILTQSKCCARDKFFDCCFQSTTTAVMNGTYICIQRVYHIWLCIKTLYQSDPRRRHFKLKSQ